MQAALDPLLRVCTLAAQGRSPTDISVFMINVLTAVMTVLASRDYLQARLAQLQVTSKIANTCHQQIDGQRVYRTTGANVSSLFYFGMANRKLSFVAVFR